MAGEAEEADLALLLCSGERFEDPIRLVSEFGIVVVDDIVHLPNVEVIGLQAGERVLEHAHSDVFLTAVGTDTGRHHGLAALALESDAETLFARAGLGGIRIAFIGSLTQPCVSRP